MIKNNPFAIFALLIMVTTALQAQQVDSHSVFFKTDEFNLSAEERIKLNEFLDNLDTINIAKISIQAFCDDRGSNLYNETLATKRATTVSDIALKLNVNNQLSYESSGKGELPLSESSNKDVKQQRAFNRRAEITISYKTEEAQKDSASSLNSLKNSKVGEIIRLENILFVGGRSVLLAESYPVLESLTNILKEHKEINIAILGHVCCAPKGEDGEDYDTGLHNLSVVRAKTVYDYLIENGINSSRLIYKGLKSNYPTGKGDKYDRRVEIQRMK